MPSAAALAAVLVAIGLAVSAAAPIERRIDRSFRVDPGSLVTVKIMGGAISVATGSARSADVRLTETVDADSDARADEILANYEVTLAQQGGEVTVVVRRKSDGGSSNRGRDRVRFDATLTVPADVRLQLNTSGGSIAVRGERTARLDADTSGGRITVDGGRGDMTLETSGGGIDVGRALGTLRSSTSGGSIRVDYVGPSATNVVLATSGGGIQVGIDPAAKLNLTAETSGGGVRVDGLTFEAQRLSRSSVTGTTNGGGGHLSAHTSGGSIEIRAARP